MLQLFYLKEIKKDTMSNNGEEAVTSWPQLSPEELELIDEQTGKNDPILAKLKEKFDQDNEKDVSSVETEIQAEAEVTCEVEDASDATAEDQAEAEGSEAETSVSMETSSSWAEMTKDEPKPEEGEFKVVEQKKKKQGNELKNVVKKHKKMLISRESQLDFKSEDIVMQEDPELWNDEQRHFADAVVEVQLFLFNHAEVDGKEEIQALKLELAAKISEEIDLMRSKGVSTEYIRYLRRICSMTKDMFGVARDIFSHVDYVEWNVKVEYLKQKLRLVLEPLICSEVIVVGAMALCTVHDGQTEITKDLYLREAELVSYATDYYRKSTECVEVAKYGSTTVKVTHDGITKIMSARSYYAKYQEIEAEGFPKIKEQREHVNRTENRESVGPKLKDDEVEAEVEQREEVEYLIDVKMMPGIKGHKLEAPKTNAVYQSMTKYLDATREQFSRLEKVESTTYLVQGQDSLTRMISQRAISNYNDRENGVKYKLKSVKSKDNGKVHSTPVLKTSMTVPELTKYLHSQVSFHVLFTEWVVSFSIACGKNKRLVIPIHDKVLPYALSHDIELVLPPDQAQARKMFGVRTQVRMLDEFSRRLDVKLINDGKNMTEYMEKKKKSWSLKGGVLTVCATIGQVPNILKNVELVEGNRILVDSDSAVQLRKIVVNERGSKTDNLREMSVQSKAAEDVFRPIRDTEIKALDMTIAKKQISKEIKEAERKIGNRTYNVNDMSVDELKEALVKASKDIEKLLRVTEELRQVIELQSKLMSNLLVSECKRLSENNIVYN